MMTLDQRIDKDLSELYSKGLKDLINNFNQCKIQEAENLSNDLFGKPNEPKPNELSSHGFPGYFTGNRKARTVMVMLNPGQDVAGKDNPVTTIETLLKLGITTNSDIDFISSYKNGNKDFGTHDKNNRIKEGKTPDNFDLKQAAFLKRWPKNCGVTIPNSFPPTNNKLESIKYEEALETAENVLTQKLQLELVPYASRDFKEIPPKNLKYLFPYVETLFDEIFSNVSEDDSRYVIFCADIFDKLFKKFKKEHPGRVKYEGVNPKKPSYDIFDQKVGKKPRPAYCTPIRIYQYDNKQGYSLKAIIAHTFPNQALPNAYDRMVKYGEFCYNTYKNSQI